ncbi:MAG: sigma-70 family RNA polymerase sigma factor [Eubacteriales bacterium]
MTENAELLNRAAAGDRTAESRLLELNGGLIRSAARRFISRCSGRGLDEDDLFQIAAIGFLKAVRNFDPDSGYALSTYAVPKMIGEIRRFLRDDGLIHVGRAVKERAARLCAERELLCAELGREPTVSELAAGLGMEPEEVCEAAAAAGALDVSIAGLAGEDDKSSPAYVGSSGSEEEIVERLALSESVKALPARERTVLALRYQRGLTQAKTAAALGMTQVQVSRTEKRAIEELRNFFDG